MEEEKEEEGGRVMCLLQLFFRLPGILYQPESKLGQRFTAN